MWTKIEIREILKKKLESKFIQNMRDREKKKKKKKTFVVFNDKIYFKTMEANSSCCIFFFLSKLYCYSIYYKRSFI